MSSFKSITHDIEPIVWPEESELSDITEEEQQREEKEIKMQLGGKQEQKESQTTTLEQPAQPVEVVALQCFGAGLAVGLLLCYFLRSNQE